MGNKYVSYVIYPGQPHVMGLTIVNFSFSRVSYDDLDDLIIELQKAKAELGKAI